MNIKQAFNLFLKWQLSEAELKKVVDKANKDSLVTYSYGQTVNRTWFLCSNTDILGLGTRVHRLGNLKSGQAMTVSEFLIEGKEIRNARI